MEDKRGELRFPTPHASEAPNRRSRAVETSTLLQIGVDVFPVCGDDDSGWGLDEGDFCSRAPRRFRYASLDELFFVLVNLSVGPEGRA
jgi:hypothetical protein